MIELIDDLPRNVVGISVTGRVTQDECRDILVPAITKSERWRDNDPSLLRARLAVSGIGVGRSRSRL